MHTTYPHPPLVFFIGGCCCCHPGCFGGRLKVYRLLPPAQRCRCSSLPLLTCYDLEDGPQGNVLCYRPLPASNILADRGQSRIPQSSRQRGVIPAAVRPPAWHLPGNPACHPMVETLKRLEDAGSHNPCLRTGEQDLLDDRDGYFTNKPPLCLDPRFLGRFSGFISIAAKISAQKFFLVAAIYEHLVGGLVKTLSS